jgi:hypothetical protein
MSPPDKHFTDVNLLGTDFLVSNQVNLQIGYFNTGIVKLDFSES